MKLVSARCTNCGGEIQLDEEKETGYCLHCGSKVIVADAIKNIRIDNSHLIENYYSLLNTAIEGDNFSEAEKYSTRIIEIDSNDANAWYLRGKAVGWLSTTQENRLSESISCWINAINCCDTNENFDKDELLGTITAEVMVLSLSMVSLLIDRFRSWPDMDVSQSFIWNLREIKSSIEKFNAKTNTQLIDLDTLLSSFLEIINKSFINIFKNKIEKEYKGTNNRPDDFDFTQYIERISASTYLLDHLLSFGRDDDLIKVNYYINLIKLHRNAIIACSWDFSGSGYYVRSRSLTKEAKKIRQNLISDYENELNNLRKQIKINEENQKAEEQRKYWEEHPEEYKIYLAVKPYKDKIKGLNKQRSKLGIFSRKDKKIIDNEISSLQQEIEKISKNRN